jgi:hypothetical protein
MPMLYQTLFDWVKKHGIIQGIVSFFQKKYLLLLMARNVNTIKHFDSTMEKKTQVEREW